MFMEHWLENGLDAFSASWVTALEDAEFLAILRLLFHHIVTAESAHELRQTVLIVFTKLFETQFGDTSGKELEWFN